MNKTLIIRALLILIVLTIVFGVYYRVSAQEEIASYLGDRLRQQNVPIVDINIVQKFPLNLQVVLQSTSMGDKAAPDDPININLIHREVILANQAGYFVGRYAIVILNNKGESMAEIEESTKLADIFVNAKSSRISDAETIIKLTQRLELFGMSLNSLDVLSSSGLQTVNIKLSTPSIDVANRVLPQFMPSLRFLLEDLNADGAQIVNCKLELRNENGDLLLNYILDLQLRAENWWMADNLTRDWFPHP